ncbi:hypothetical protein [Edaphobacter aggregans]|uniref:hypothetical protein n=1 Tax=Edaphobacter aggregans TaxID=570835 RepID=UPI0012F72447|nr:hypothetical protein [Edaphobacter aggregans]
MNILAVKLFVCPEDDPGATPQTTHETGKGSRQLSRVCDPSADGHLGAGWDC